MIKSLSAQNSFEGFLYHYTSQAGLLGIIQKREIWATNLLFLNDSAELNYAIRMMRQEIENLKEKLSEEEFRFIKEFSENLDGINSPLSQHVAGIYVCSFSEKENQLSQWRGYCPDEGGFSVGFDFNSSLGKLIETQDFTLVKCVYREKEQLILIQNFLEEVLDNFRKNGNDLSNPKRWEDFFQLAPILKHPKFEEEDEWRLISKPRSLDDVQFRVGKSMLIPYVKIKLTEWTESSGNSDKMVWRCIPKIYIGPTPHPNLSHISLENMLCKEGGFSDFDTDGMLIRECLIVESKIPYHSW